MSELMHRNPQAGGLVNTIGDLSAEGDLVLVSLALTWKEPVFVPAPQQCRPEVVNIFVDDLSQFVAKLKIQLHAVLDVEVGKPEPVVGFSTRRLDQIEAYPYRCQIGEAYRREAEDGYRDRQLRFDGRLDRRVIVKAGFFHEVKH